MPCSLRRNSTREDLLDLGGREAGHRLVGEQEPRRAGDGAGEFELAHLDLGQIARQMQRLVGEPDIGEQLRGSARRLRRRKDARRARALTV